MSRTLRFAPVLSLGIVLAIAASAYASTFRVIYTFGTNGASDAALPGGGLVMDAAGNLYGTTVGGGAHGGGTVFELSPSANGDWTEKVLYSFTGIADGGGPFGGVVLDAKGNLYGTTQQGGMFSSGTCSAGCGVAYELVPSETGWTERLLHTFTGGTDGGTPDNALILDSEGNLYGTTYNGGAGDCTYGCGVVFELVRTEQWSENVLHSFEGNPDDGANPASALVFDGSGNLFGTTVNGGHTFLGSGAPGTIFELTAASDGTWNEVIIHNFCSNYDCSDGNLPEAGVTVRGSRIYGTTISGGGAGPYGSVYELAQTASGWQLTASAFDLTNGAQPMAPVLLHGELQYGVTQQGGIVNGACGLYPNGNGVVFEVAQNKQALNETVLYSFTGGDDGCGPTGGLVADAAGNLYGTTFNGGSYSSGVAFEVTP